MKRFFGYLGLGLGVALVTTVAWASFTGTGPLQVVDSAGDNFASIVTTLTSATPAGTNVIGGVTASLGTTNGWTPLRMSGLSTTVTAIKASAGELGMLQCYNPNAVVIYVQVFNLAFGSVTLGTTAPTLSIPIAATSTGGYALANPGINFSAAMSAAVTTTATGLTAAGTATDCNVVYN